MAKKSVNKKHSSDKVIEVEIDVEKSKIERLNPLIMNDITNLGTEKDLNDYIYETFLNKWSHDQNLQNVVNELMKSNNLVWTEKLLKAIDISYDLTMKYDRRSVYKTFKMFLEKFIKIGV